VVRALVREHRFIRVVLSGMLCCARYRGTERAERAAE
jgi:hypothetical protein